MPFWDVVIVAFSLLYIFVFKQIFTRWFALHLLKVINGLYSIVVDTIGL